MKCGEAVWIGNGFGCVSGVLVGGAGRGGAGRSHMVGHCRLMEMPSLRYGNKRSKNMQHPTVFFWNMFLPGVALKRTTENLASRSVSLSMHISSEP